jgi:hypothetical protein
MTVRGPRELNRAAMVAHPREPATTPDLDRLAVHLFDMPTPDHARLAELDDFALKVMSERARLAAIDPVGELDAVHPLGRITAREIELELDQILSRRSTRSHKRRRSITPRSSIRLDESALLDRLGADLRRGNGVIRCPAHEDKRPSLSWRFRDGRALIHCWAGCSFDEIRRAAA